jgi:hypothetical protein
LHECAEVLAVVLVLVEVVLEVLVVDELLVVVVVVDELAVLVVVHKMTYGRTPENQASNLRLHSRSTSPLDPSMEVEKVEDNASHSAAHPNAHPNDSSVSVSGCPHENKHMFV